MRPQRIVAITLASLATCFALASPAMAAGTLDQQYTVDDFGDLSVYGSTQQAQVFTAGLTGVIDQLDLKVKNFGTSLQDLTMIFRGTTSGLPSGPALATVSVPRSATQNTPATWVSFVLPTPLAVVAGTQYAVTLSTSESNINNAYGWELGFSSLYAGGASVNSSNSGATWSVNGGLSFDFKSYVTVASAGTGPAPAPVFQQFGRQGNGTCDAAAPNSLNWGGADSGGWGNSWAQWMNGGDGGAVCTRTLVYSNTLGRWVVG